MRIDKFLAHNNFGSRKSVRILLKDNRVKINDDVVKNAKTTVNLETDVVYVDDEPINYEPLVYIMMNKPQGYECTHMPDLYPSILDLLDFYREDIFFVGRLDVDTEGLLLITNDGTFSHNIVHGKKEIYKTYFVELEQTFDTNFIEALEKGITLNEQPLKPAFVKIINDTSIELSIAEGKYHQVKRMMHYCNNEVTYLKRLSIGTLKLDESLALGTYRALTEEEIEMY